MISFLFLLLPISIVRFGWTTGSHTASNLFSSFYVSNIWPGGSIASGFSFGFVLLYFCSFLQTSHGVPFYVNTRP